MNFDYTHGEDAKYLVLVTAWNVVDRYYFHSYREAKGMFNRLLDGKYGGGAIISVYDMKKDVRKDFAKIKGGQYA